MWCRQQACNHRATQKRGYDHPGVFEVTSVGLYENTDPYGKSHKINHAREVAKHEDGPALQGVRSLLMCHHWLSPCFFRGAIYRGHRCSIGLYADKEYSTAAGMCKMDLQDASYRFSG
jgi:hypothetical protein